MKSFQLFAILALVGTFLFTSCKETAKTDEANEAVAVQEPVAVQDMASPTQVPNADPQNAEAVPTGPLTSIKFDKDEYDFGKIMDGEKVTHIFKFKNTGNEPLIISDAKASCGCTVPDWPRDAIAPGKSGEIKVVYDSKGKGAVGGKNDSKRVTIKANTDPMETYLNIKGIIDKKEGEQ